MELEVRIEALAKKVRDHREILATEEAAKNALVMPFLQALGYDIFDPGEVVPEFTCDVGTKKGEKVDYAICDAGKVRMLVECKPANGELSLKHASQLFRYFAVTDARVALLTNGITFKFYSDIDRPNTMDEQPFFTLQLDDYRKADVKILESFTKAFFDVEKIVAEAGNLKLQSLVYKALAAEFDSPSEEFVKLIAGRVYQGMLTQKVRENFRTLITRSLATLIRDQVNSRINSALIASNPEDDVDVATAETSDIETTEVEIEGFNIVRAIAARKVSPDRIVMRDAKSYCAVLLDDNNRKSLVRLHFNSDKVRYLGVFSGKDETRHHVDGPVDIYKFEDAILARLAELEE